MPDPEPICSPHNRTELQPWLARPGAMFVPRGDQLDSILEHRQIPPPDDWTWRPRHCIIARTYAGHAPSKTIFSINKFIAAFELQTDPHWHLVFVDTDPGKEFNYLHETVRKWASQHDPLRIRIVKTMYRRGKIQDRWAKHEYRDHYQYHSDLYEQTNAAVDHFCPAGSEYLIITNADNWYHPDFLRRASGLMIERDAQILGTDFTSRYAMNTWGIPWIQQSCQIQRMYHPTICNGLFPAYTDLGSMVFNYTRWRQDNVSFARIIDMCFYPPPMADGCLAFHLRKEFAWNGVRLAQPMFAHAPNAWICHAYGGRFTMETGANKDVSFSCVEKENAPQVLEGQTVDYLQYEDGGCYQPKKFASRPTRIELTGPPSN
jgi:hypothetical protein